MSDRLRELDYYREQCKQMGRQILQLQAEQMRTRREARRSRMVAELVRKVYGMGEDFLGMDRVGKQYLQIILNTLTVDCAIILNYHPEKDCFITQNHLGCRTNPPSDFKPPVLPEPFLYINSNTTTNPLVQAMKDFCGMSFILWAFDARSGMALMVCNTIEDQHLHRPFDENDREIMEAALMVFEDISDQLSSKMALLKSEEKYRLLVENANDAIFIVQDGVIKFHNSKAIEMFGYPSEELMKFPLVELVHPSDRAGVIERQKIMLRGKSIPRPYSFRTINRDGQILWIDINHVRIDWEDRAATLSFCRDITQQKHLELQLRNTQKLEAIGTLAGGIAHDFNNILSAIIGYSEITAISLVEGSVVQNNLKQILHAGNRAKELVKQILTFSRQHKQERVPVQIHLIIKEALKLLRPALPSTIDIKQNIDSKGAVMADPTQIHQVVMNLCTNAYHAMQDTGGELNVSLSEIDLDSNSVTLYPGIEPGRYLKLLISDTGCGMGEEVQQRIFDPYFTTKEKGKGTGLGLAVVHGIVTSMKGSITVNSQVGKGTSFEILFPKKEKIEETTIETAEELSYGNERILFVDDEANLAVLSKQILEGLGFKVTCHTSSIEARDDFRENPDNFDLIITDMTMPKMTGDRLAEEVLQIRPDIPIILCTGYSEQITRKRAEQIGIKALLNKPLSASDFSKAIRNALKN